MGGRLRREEINIYMADSSCTAEPTQHCKAVILQSKGKKKERVYASEAEGMSLVPGQ